MPEVPIEIQVWCSCGNGLCSQSYGSSNSRGSSITVEPCEKCLAKARDEGYDDGFQEAEDKFREE